MERVKGKRGGGKILVSIEDRRIGIVGCPWLCNVWLGGGLGVGARREHESNFVKVGVRVFTTVNVCLIVLTRRLVDYCRGRFGQPRSCQ